MAKLYNILRLTIHLSLFLIFGKYLEEIISFPFLIFSFVLINIVVLILFKLKLRTIIALPILLIVPWLIRILIIIINLFDRSFLQISFDMNFFLILVPIYISSIFSWISLVNLKVRKYEVLFNGLFLFLLFWQQGNYRVTLVPNPVYLAIFTIIFILLELLVLYLSINLERELNKKIIESFREFGLFFLLLIPLIIYLLMPLWEKYEEGSVAGGGGLLKSSMFRFDFSEYIKLETEISMSDDLVLMYRKEGPAERMLLRRYVLSGYEEGQGFYRHDLDKLSPPDKLSPRFQEFEEESYKNREAVKQELFLVNIDPTAFLSLNYPINSQPIYNWDNSSFVRIYQSDAMVSTLRIREIDPLISMDDGSFEHYTYTGENEGIGALAKDITYTTPGSLLKTMEIEDYFHNNYFYSLKPGVAPDGDQLSYFINKSKKGYCSYFAFSMALMCRSLGIPARVAVGFWVDPEVSVLNFYPVRADQAHAWVEVYFNDYGWIEFDPTSGTMFPGEQYPFASFTIDEFSPLIEEILDHELLAENLADQNSDLNDDGERATLLSSIYNFLWKHWYVIVLGSYFIYILIYRFGLSLLLLFVSNNRRKTRYTYLITRMKLSFERKSYRESLIEYSERLEKNYHISFKLLTEIYLKSVFSPSFTDDDFFEFMRLKEQMFKEYRNLISPGKRFLYFLFPFIRSFHK